MSPQPPDSLPPIPAGPWKGWYQLPQPHSQALHWMDLLWQQTQPALVGSGLDDVGLFDLQGQQYGPRCELIKAYRGRHSVGYLGYWDGFTITGQWIIPNVWQGSFSIWPLSG